MFASTTARPSIPHCPQGASSVPEGYGTTHGNSLETPGIPVEQQYLPTLIDNGVTGHTKTY